MRVLSENPSSVENERIVGGVGGGVWGDDKKRKLPDLCVLISDVGTHFLYCLAFFPHKIRDHSIVS